MEVVCCLSLKGEDWICNKPPTPTEDPRHSQPSEGCRRLRRGGNWPKAQTERKVEATPRLALVVPQVPVGGAGQAAWRRVLQGQLGLSRGHGGSLREGMAGTGVAGGELREWWQIHSTGDRLYVFKPLPQPHPLPLCSQTFPERVARPLASQCTG